MYAFHRDLITRQSSWEHTAGRGTGPRSEGPGLQKVVSSPITAPGLSSTLSFTGACGSGCRTERFVILSTDSWILSAMISSGKDDLRHFTGVTSLCWYREACICSVYLWCSRWAATGTRAEVLPKWMWGKRTLCAICLYIVLKGCYLGESIGYLQKLPEPVCNGGSVAPAALQASRTTWHSISWGYANICTC